MWDFDLRKTGEARIVAGDQEVVLQLKMPTGLQHSKIEQKLYDLQMHKADNPDEVDTESVTQYLALLIEITVTHEGKNITADDAQDLLSRLDATSFASLAKQVQDFVFGDRRGN
jgi:hypothetical protein